MQSLQPGVADTYTLTVNGNDTTVSILMLTQPPGDVPPPSADSERGLRTFVTVDPAIGDPAVASTFTYTIRVENWSDEPEDVNKILNELPPGFAYAASSTLLDGSPFDDPASSGKRRGTSLTRPLRSPRRESPRWCFRPAWTRRSPKGITATRRP
ncbi:MAG: hypothetical protein IH862_08040 [Chloroflexi bacterium]|nr:hypothetical protein [Chloroflexota bacterium]